MIRSNYPVSLGKEAQDSPAWDAYNFGKDTSAKVVRFAMERYKLPQKKIAALLGVDPSYVSRVARAERSLTMAHLEKLSESFELPVAVIVWMAVRPQTHSPARAAVFGEIDKLMEQAFGRALRGT